MCNDVTSRRNFYDGVVLLLRFTFYAMRYLGLRSYGTRTVQVHCDLIRLRETLHDSAMAFWKL